MFHVKVGDKDIRFTFKHLTFGRGAPAKASTSCFLEVDQKGAIGIAACAWADNFNKERGRKLALARAIAAFRKTNELTYHERDIIWNRYFWRSIPNGTYTYPMFPDEISPVQATSEAQAKA